MKTQLRSFMFSALFLVPALVPSCGGDASPVASDDGNPAFTRALTLPMPTVTQVSTPAPVAVVAPAALPVAPTKFDDALAQGKDLAAKGDTVNAREMFEAAIKLDKKRAEPHIELARMFIATHERGLAMAAANKAVKLAPDSSLAWNTLGRAELNRFNYDGAETAFEKAVEVNADNVWAWNNLGLVELQLKKYDEAAVHFTEATNRKGATGYMFNNLGIALEQLDRLDEARTAFEKGGGVGSSEAVASRKRLEGVKSIAIAAPAPMPEAKTYDNTEESSPSPSEGSDVAPDAGVTPPPTATN